MPQWMIADEHERLIRQSMEELERADDPSGGAGSGGGPPPAPPTRQVNEQELDELIAEIFNSDPEEEAPETDSLMLPNSSHSQARKILVEKPYRKQ